MNITLFIGSVSVGGAERVVCNLANYLAEKGHTVEILVMSETKRSYFIRPEVKVIPLIKNAERKNRLYNVVVRYYRLVRYMRNRKDVDRYIVLLPWTMIMMLSLARMTKAKIIASERSNPASYPIFMRFLLKHYFKYADGLVFQTSGALKWCNTTIKNVKSVVIPNAINPEFIRDPFTGVKIKRIVAAGRLIPLKNYALLINAFAKIADIVPEYHLVIFGKGAEQKNLEKLSKKLGIVSKVLFPGYVDNMPEELEKSSLFILSSNYEGMPNTLMEAMALGLPCISTDCPCGGPRFLIEDGVNGFLVPVGDSDRMAERMRDILLDDEKRNRVGRKAMVIRETFSPDKIYQRWEDFIVGE